MLLMKWLFALIFAVVYIFEGHAESNAGNIWVVLVAGSHTYKNYRHQSNVYHAYQVIKSRGIPDENVIVMQYDDIAYNKLNPKKGQVFNQLFGPNVYKNITKDYVGEHVTAENFLNVLSGNVDKMKNIGSGRVVNSTDKDNIFVFYTDHGGSGVLSFIGGILYAVDLMATLKTMTINKKYSKIVFFTEACYSGSMFENILPNDTGIYAMTSANHHESSYATYYSSIIRAYLGGEYSTNMLEILDEGFNLSINELYEKIKNEVDNSHVSQYGDLSVAENPVSAFIGVGQSVRLEPTYHYSVHHDDNDDNSVPSLDVPIALLQREIETATNLEEKERFRNEIKRLLKDRAVADEILDNILTDACENDEAKYSYLKTVNFTITLDNMHCAKAVTKAFDENCFRITENPYVVGMIEDLVKLCNVVDWWFDQEQAVEVIIKNVCEQYEEKPLRVL